MWPLLSGVLAFLVLVGSAVIILLARRDSTARETALTNVTALTALVGTRNMELADKTRDLEILTAEHKQLIQVNSKEMMTAWQQHVASSYYIQNASLRLINDELKARLAKHEIV